MAIQTQLACVTVGHVLSRMPLFASNTALLEAVAPFVFRTVAIEGVVQLGYTFKAWLEPLSADGSVAILTAATAAAPAERATKQGMAVGHLHFARTRPLLP